MRLENHWQTHNWLSCLLWCPSLLFRLLVLTRRYLYRKGFLNVFRAKAPVVVIGNITVGGTGKTPLIIAMAKCLTKKSYTPVIVSRGYGTSNKTPVVVNQTDKASDVGDEPLLIARKAKVPVVVCSNRALAVAYANQIKGCDVVLSDDGLQHYAMHRDIEIVCIDGERMFGNQLCLPAGPLREPLSRLKSVDFILYKTGRAASVDRFNIVGRQLVSLTTPKVSSELSALANQCVHAVAGIANPNGFFNLLRSNRLSVIEHIFPDHHRFVESDLVFNDTLPIIMTGKDAVKCSEFTLPNAWYLSVDAVLHKRFTEQLITALTACK